MPPSVCQLLFCRIHDTVQFSSYYTNDRLVPGFGDGHTKEFEQRPNTVFVTVRVLAAKTTNRVKLVRLKICRARVQLVGMLVNPWTGDVVLAGTQRRLVEPPRLERRNDRVLLGLRGPDLVRVVTGGVRAIDGP